MNHISLSITDNIDLLFFKIKFFVSPKGTPPPKAVGLTLFSWITLIGSDQIIFHEFFSSGKILNS